MFQELYNWEHPPAYRQGGASVLRWRRGVRRVSLRLCNLCAIKKLQLPPRVDSPWFAEDQCLRYLTTPGSTRPLSARSLQAAASRSSTTRSLPPSSHSRSTTDSRQCTNWPRCAPSGCPSSRVGEQNITARTWLPLHAGSRSTCTGPSSGWTRCSPRWAAPRTSSPPSPSCYVCSVISNASNIETKYRLWIVPFETFASSEVTLLLSLSKCNQAS